MRLVVLFIPSTPTGLYRIGYQTNICSKHCLPPPWEFQGTFFFHSLKPYNPVVVSSHPPWHRKEAQFFRCAAMYKVASVINNNVRPAIQSKIQMFLIFFFRCIVPCVNIKPSSARAAATSSWVDSGLLPVTETCPPPIAKSFARYAVFASRCTDTVILIPSKGFVFANSSSSFLKAAYSSYQFIFCLPDFARLISRITLPIFYTSRRILLF